MVPTTFLQQKFFSVNDDCSDLLIHKYQNCCQHCKYWSLNNKQKCEVVTLLSSVQYLNDLWTLKNRFSQTSEVLSEDLYFYNSHFHLTFSKCQIAITLFDCLSLANLLRIQRNPSMISFLKIRKSYFRKTHQKYINPPVRQKKKMLKLIIFNEIDI